MILCKMEAFFRRLAMNDNGEFRSTRIIYNRIKFKVKGFGMDYENLQDRMQKFSQGSSLDDGVQLMKDLMQAEIKISKYYELFLVETRKKGLPDGLVRKATTKFNILNLMAGAGYDKDKMLGLLSFTIDECIEILDFMKKKGLTNE